MLFLLVAFATCCSGISVVRASNRTERVVGTGRLQASYAAGSYPFITWQVALQIVAGSEQFLCGGSLIAPNFVLSAGHCVKDLTTGNTLRNPENIQVIPGHSQTETTNAEGVLRFWVNPTYDTSTEAENRIDLSILQLIEPFPLSTEIEPIAMCGNSGPSPSGVPLSKVSVSGCYPVTNPVTSVWVSGYGETTSGESNSVSNTLNYAQLQTISQAKCNQVWNTNFGCHQCLPATDVCAGSDPAADGNDACFGDSGGPLFIDFNKNAANPDYELLAAVSTGTIPAQSSLPACGAPNNYGVYVSVSQNLIWINNVMNGMLNSSAVDSACIAAGNCLTTNGGGSSPSGFTFPLFYIIIIVLAACGLALFLTLCILRACRRNPAPRRQPEPVPMVVYPSQQQQQPQVQRQQTTVQVQYQPAAPPMPPPQAYNAQPMFAPPAYLPPTDNPFLVPGPWICPACTFHNAGGAVCQMCHTARPPPPMNPAAYPGQAPPQPQQYGAYGRM